MAISQRGRLSRGTRCRSGVLASDALQKRQVVDLRLYAMALRRVGLSARRLKTYPKRFRRSPFQLLANRSAHELSFLVAAPNNSHRGKHWSTRLLASRSFRCSAST